MVKPIAAIIAWCARHAVITVLAIAALALWGWSSLRAVPLDAIPDLSDVQVIVATEWKGRAADLVEDQITYPICAGLVSAPRVTHVRGQSFLGLSFVSVVFADGTDLYWARSRVLEYLASSQPRLPAGVVPALGPDASGLGWVFEYALVDRSGKHDPAELRAFQDFHLRYALASVEGVAEVATIGGATREYQVALDPVKLAARGISAQEVAMAVRRANGDVGGRVIEIAGHEIAVRGRGYVHAKADLEAVALKAVDGVPVRLGDVATVQFGPGMGRGVAELDGEGETVGGVVVMRSGANAATVIAAVKRRLEESRALLPAGVEVVPTYDRSTLIDRAISNLRRTLIEEMLVVAAIIAVFLASARAAVVAIVALPVAVLLAFIPMLRQGLSADLMSLGGIAVAIGAMVDAAIIMVENVHRRLADPPPDEPRHTTVVRALQEVGPSVFFALLVITVSFLPVFTLQGTEGRLFRPLAFTKTWSMAAAALLAVTLVPALSVILLRRRPHRGGGLEHALSAAYAPMVRLAARRPWTVVLAAVAAMALTIPAFLQLGSEFMPPLNEGTLLYMPTSPPGMSVTEATRVLQAMDREIRTIPEVERVFGKAGSAETSTDPAPLNMFETLITLKPESQWRPGMTWERIKDELDHVLVWPGMPNIWWMPVQTRTEMLATGVRSPLAAKVFGPSLAAIEQAGAAIERALRDDPRTARYVRGAFAERVGGGFYLDLTVKRDAIARYGLAVADVEEAIETAIGGMPVGQTVEGRERFPISVRYARDFREEPEALARVLVATPAGAQIPLRELVDSRFATGPMMIATEGGELTAQVAVTVDGIGIPDFVETARRVVSDIALPPGVRVAWAGQYEHWQSAAERLRVVVPLTLAIVVALLALNTGSLVETAMVLLAVPFSLIGAVWLLRLLSYKISVATWVGMIALAGLDAETGVVMLLYLTIAWRHARERGRMASRHDLEEAIVDGAARRIRPKLMTALCLLLGLLPAMWSDGTGADVMKRIAAPMVGGVVTSFLLELAVYPALFALWKRRGLRG